MKSELSFAILVSGSILTGVVLYLHKRKKIREYNFPIWLVSSLFIILYSLAPSILDFVINFVGVYHPPILLLLFSLLIIIFMFLHHSIQITILDNQLRELSRHSAAASQQQKI